MDLSVPRVRDVPASQEPFESKGLRKYPRRSDTIDATFMTLFLEQYEAFDPQDLHGRAFVYLGADGIYLQAGLGTEKVCLMVLIGADTAGGQPLIALREGYRQSTDSGGGLLADCFQRGLHEPACWMGDGNLGLWAAMDAQSPPSAQQRCTNHKTRNVVDKLPKAERPEAIQRRRAVWPADREKAARPLAEKWIQDYRPAGYDRAADCREKDLDRGVTFYPFPEAHGSHLRTSNPIESIFRSVRLRTKAARRFKKTQSGVWLVHQGIERLAKRWRRLCSSHLCGTVPLPGRQVLVAMPA